MFTKVASESEATTDTTAIAATPHATATDSKAASAKTPGTKTADKDQEPQKKTSTEPAMTTLAVPVQAQPALHPDLRSWSLALPRSQKAESAKTEPAAGDSADESETDKVQQKVSASSAPLANAKPIAFGVNLQKEQTKQEAEPATPAVSAVTTATSDSKSSSSGKHSDTHQKNAKESDSSGTHVAVAAQAVTQNNNVVPSTVPTLSNSATTNAVPISTSVPAAYTPNPRAAAPATQTTHTAEISEPPSPPASKPQSITFSTGTGANEVNVRVAERAGDVQVTVRTADADMATSLRDHIPELSNRLAQTGVSADIWSPQGISNSETSSNSDTSADEQSQQQQNFAGSGGQHQQQNRQPSSGFTLDGADGESN